MWSNVFHILKYLPTLLAFKIVFLNLFHKSEAKLNFLCLYVSSTCSIVQNFCEWLVQLFYFLHDYIELSLIQPRSEPYL